MQRPCESLGANESERPRESHPLRHLLVAPEHLRPRSVEVRLFHSEERRATHIMLVNLTTNPLIQMGIDPAVVRYITPHKGLHLTLRSESKVKRVRSLIGTRVMYREEDGMVHLELPSLDLYDSIIVEYS